MILEKNQNGLSLRYPGPVHPVFVDASRWASRWLNVSRCPVAVAERLENLMSKNHTRHTHTSTLLRTPGMEQLGGT